MSPNQNITAGIIGFLMMAVIAYMFLTFCSISFRCGEGFEQEDDDMTMSEQAKRLEQQQILMRDKGNYTPMEQVTQNVAESEAEGDAMRLQENMHEAPVQVMEARHRNDPVGFSSFQPEYASP